MATVSQPFTGQTQVQAWPGGDFWEGTITLPKMPRAQASQWIAFLMATRGMTNCFMLGDPYMNKPQGNPVGNPVVDSSITGYNNPMTTTLYTKGWTHSSSRLLLPGDRLQIGIRMHTVLNTVTSDTSGGAQIQIWPSIREQPSTNDVITFYNPKGIFRLASNNRTWSVDETRLFGLSFKIREAK